MSAFIQKVRPYMLSLLGLGVAYLMLCLSTTVLYSAWLRLVGTQLDPRFFAFAAIYGLVFNTLCGYLVGLIARRRPVLHACLFALMLVGVWAFSIVMYGTRESAFVLLLNLSIAIGGSLMGGWLRYWQVATRRSLVGMPEVVEA